MTLQELRSSVLGLPKIWQYDLLNADGLRKYCEERNLKHLDVGAIKSLFALGLLRADSIYSQCELEHEGIDLVSKTEQGYTYADNRVITLPVDGYGGILSKPHSFPIPEDVRFHPFRFYSLHRIVQIFGSNMAKTVYLQNPDAAHKITQSDIDYLNTLSSTEQSTSTIIAVDELASLAIVLDPIGCPIVFDSERYSVIEGKAGYLAKRNKYLMEVREYLRDFPQQDILESIRKLCIDAQLLDKNTKLHFLVRQMNVEFRKKIRDGIGAAVCLLTMAEVIRRTYEHTRVTELPEEDELGFAFGVQDYKQKRFGTARLLDSDIVTKNHVLDSYGLSFSVKARCYVEGETELGALTYAVGEFNGVEFINLAGRFAEKGDKSLAFVESLKRDKSAHVFSIVVIDKDQSDYVRMLRRSAEKEEFFGAFYLSDPDIEFGNFSPDELTEIIQNSVDDNAEKSIVLPTEFRERVRNCSSGKTLMKCLQDFGIAEIAKGESWGELLMKFALRETEPDGDKRPIVEAVKLLLNCRRSDYKYSFEKSRVDPLTGLPVDRE